MAYNNQFSMEKYFQNNYGLPKKPAQEKLNLPKNIIVLILFWWISVIVYLIKKSKRTKEIAEWDAAYNHRFNNWYK